LLILQFHCERWLNGIFSAAIIWQELLGRIPQKEKPYLGGYDGEWYGTLKEAAEAACSK